MKPLQEYARKRDFKKTLEPKGVLGTKGKSLQFVVQEHHASHLHYDFRLEWEGVLKSWAVPKGPSLDPAQKRLAVEVEDHPVKYGSFEGRIPEGEYGAGEVFLWDNGNWQPIGDPKKGLRSGRLEFELQGKKLKGRWILVRTRRSAQGAKHQWLLMKRKDAFARVGDAVQPRTLNSKAKRGAPEKSSQTKTNFPDFIPPQLAKLVSHPPEGPEWLHELKFDGYRLQLHIHNDKIKIFTRNGHDWTEKFPSLVKDVKKLGVNAAILDGEAVVVDESGISNFQLLQNALESGKSSAILFYAFDLLFLGTEDLREYPLGERKKVLAALLDKKKPKGILYSEHFSAVAEDFLESSCKLHLEGMISKRADSSYTSGRDHTWLKSKCTKRQEFVIGGFTDPQGSRMAFGALLLGVYEGKRLRYCGRVGTGFNRESLQTILKKLRKHESATSPFAIRSPKEGGIHWTKPVLVAEIAFANWTKEGVLRAPVFQGLREDKPAQEIHREKTVEADKLKPSDKELDPFHGFSSKDKILFSNPQVTKLDLAKFYLKVAPHLLPHATQRPLSLLRCPEGWQKGCFFQKHFHEESPEHVHTHSGETSEKDFLTIDSPEGLVALVQRGSIEFHAQNVRAADPTRPDQLVMDFDPGPGVDWKKVKQAALDLKNILDQLDLIGFLKVSGGKGLHVHVPFEPLYDTADVKEFSHALAREMVNRNPELYTVTIAKKARKGKIFVDYLRNGESSTAVLPYSVRAREGAPVALPIAWAQLKNLKSASAFSLPRVSEILRTRKKDPWQAFFTTQQKLPHLKPS